MDHVLCIDGYMTDNALWVN